MELTNQIFSSACQKINEFKKDKEVIIYGGGRLLLGFLNLVSKTIILFILLIITYSIKQNLVTVFP